MTDHERAAADFAVKLTHDEIPDTVRDHAQLVLADTVAAIIGGSTDSVLATFVNDTCTTIPGESSILGHNVTTTRTHAAVANGSCGTVLELDEGHKYAAGHPAIHVLPAVLADAEAADATGEALVTAFVAGYEVITRVARGCYPLADDYHPHGVWGPVGAAAGVAAHRGYSSDKTVTAMRIAANQAQHTLMAAATEGATVRQTFAGMANLTGLVAADLAAAGLTGLEDGVARHLELAADDVDRTEFDAALGESWEITRGYFKRHAACRYTHPTLDALAALQADHDVDGTTVEAVRVETFPTAAGLDETQPHNALQAKFSMPFAVATRLVNETSGKGAFTDDAITDVVLDLASRISIVATDEMTDRLPDARSARVTVELANGRTLMEEVEHAEGGDERPYDEDDIAEKFDELVTSVLDAETASDLWELLRNGSPSAREVARLTRP